MGKKRNGKKKERQKEQWGYKRLNSQDQPQRSQSQSPVSPDNNPHPETTIRPPIMLDSSGFNNKGTSRVDPREVQEGPSHDLPIYHPNFQDILDDQRPPTLQAGASSVLLHSPPKSPRDRHPGGLFGGTSGNVAIKGGTFHNTYGHHHHTNLTIQFTPLRAEHYGASPQHSPPLLVIPDNPLPLHAQDSYHSHIPPVDMHNPGPSLPIPHTTSPHVPYIHGYNPHLSIAPRAEHYDAFSQHPPPILVIPDNPTPLHAPNIHHHHIPLGAVHNPGPSVPTPNITSPPILDIHGLQSPPMSMPSQNHSTSSVVRSPDNSNKIYERHLELKRRGFPLWIPEPNRTLPMPYRREGVNIGDVGIITPSGAFSFLFNICLPPNHPINPPMLPDGFLPIYPPIDPRDIREFSEFKPESYLASTAIEKTHNDPPFRGLSFATSAAEGALLTLPDGAIARDLENIRQFRKYAKANIESWYRYVNGPRGREAKNGEVRLVTGCDKASSWGMAAIASITENKVHHFKYRSIEDVAPIAPIPLYKWEHTGFAEARVGPDLQEIEDLRRDDSNAAMGGKYKNQCLFVRTLNITLSDDAFAKISQDIESPLQQFRHSASSTESIYESLESRGSPVESVSVAAEVAAMSRFPISPISHPADILNKLLLLKVPTSRVVITRDEDWSSVINEKDDEIMSNPSEIAERVLAASDIREEDGVIFLEPKIKRQSVQTPPSQPAKDHSHSPSLSGSTSFAPSECESIPTLDLRTSPLDTSNLSLASQSLPILLDESELFKNMAPEDIIIAVMGPSGTGKSTFINTLLGSKVAVTSGSLFSCTQEVHAFGCLRPGRSDQKIIIVDTPGFDDTNRTDYDVLDGIAKWLETTYSKRIKLSGVLHFHSIRDSRMRRTPQRNLAMFQRLCGPKALKNVVLLTTFWDELERQDIGLAREKQLSELFWKPLIDKGSRTERFDPPSYERAWKIVDRFPPAGIPLAIQVEMVDEHKKLWETSVFQFLVQWWTQLVNKIRGYTQDPSQTDVGTNDALRQQDALLGSMPSSASVISIRSASSPASLSSFELTPKWFRDRRKKTKTS